MEIKYSGCLSRKWIISLMGIYSCALMFAQRSAMGVAIENMAGEKDSEFDWNGTLKVCLVFSWGCFQG